MDTKTNMQVHKKSTIPCRLEQLIRKPQPQQQIQVQMPVNATFSCSIELNTQLCTLFFLKGGYFIKKELGKGSKVRKKIRVLRLRPK